MMCSSCWRPLPGSHQRNKNKSRDNVIFAAFALWPLKVTNKMNSCFQELLHSKPISAQKLLRPNNEAPQNKELRPSQS